MIFININDYERNSNVGDVLNCNCIEKGEFNYSVIEKYDNYKIVDKDLEGSDVFIKNKDMIII
jgi:hypothetical protein